MKNKVQCAALGILAALALIICAACAESCAEFFDIGHFAPAPPLLTSDIAFDLEWTITEIDTENTTVHATLANNSGYFISYYRSVLEFLCAGQWYAAPTINPIRWLGIPYMESGDSASVSELFDLRRSRALSRSGTYPFPMGELFRLRQTVTVYAESMRSRITFDLVAEFTWE